MPSVPSVYSVPLTVVGGSGDTVSSTRPAPSGTSTSRVTRAPAVYTVTAVIRLVAIFTPTGPAAAGTAAPLASTRTGSGSASTRAGGENTTKERPTSAHRVRPKTTRCHMDCSLV